MNTTQAQSFGQFVSSGLKLRPSQAITIPAPTVTAAALDSERQLRAALQRDTMRAPSPHTDAVLADLECSWEV